MQTANQIWLVYNNYKSWSWILNYQSFEFSVSLKVLFLKKEIKKERKIQQLLTTNDFAKYNLSISECQTPYWFYPANLYDACREINIIYIVQVGVLLDAKAMTLIWKRNRQRGWLFISLITTGDGETNDYFSENF